MKLVEAKRKAVEDAVAEEFHAARKLARTGVVIGIAAFLSVGAWAAMAPISGAIIAAGLVKVETNRKTIQHQEGGIVKEIRVHDGDRVTQGQPLIVLGDVKVEAALSLVRTQLDAELARNARLAAERELAQQIIFPEALTHRADDPRVAELLRREQALFEVRRDALRSQVTLLRTQAGEARGEIEARLAQRKTEGRALDLQREEVEANRSLSAQGFVSRTRLLTLQRTEADYQARREENLAELSRARQKIPELELRAVTLQDHYVAQAANEHKESTARLFDLQERLRPSEDAAARQVIAAPVSGVVVDLKVSTAGAAIGPREALMDIVPENPSLLIEAHVRPEDINHVRPGTAADVRLTAFNQRLTPVVSGEIQYVAADRMTSPDGKTAYYVARVRVNAQSLREAGNLQLQAGMPAEVFVKTAARTPLEYFVDPILGFLRRAAREP